MSFKDIIMRSTQDLKLTIPWICGEINNALDLRLIVYMQRSFEKRLNN